jgi:hypothetical protein
MATKKTTKSKNTAVTKSEGTSTLPVAFEGYGDYEGKGFQNQTQEDIAIPFVNVLQAMSPEVQPDGVEGAKAGQLINSVSQELYDEIGFVPSITQHVFVEWVPRDAGGGIVATHTIDSDIVKAAKARSTSFGKYTTEDGNDLVETYYLFGVLCTPEGDSLGMALMAFTSTKIKAYRHIMGRLNSFQIRLEDGRRINPPLFAHALKISTRSQKNAKGTFYVPSIEPAVDNDVTASLLSPEDPRFLMAAECEKLVDAGRAKADDSGQAGAEASADPEEEMPF